MNVGIEQNTKLVYEADSTYGHPVWPAPIMLQVVITTTEQKTFIPAKANDLGPNSFIFREDTYNSSSRVRRGRIYKAGDSQPSQWYVSSHPALVEEQTQGNGYGGKIPKSIYAFQSVRIKSYLKTQGIKDPIFLMGNDHGFTIWTLVSTETSATDDEMVTFRARKSIGALPQLYREKIFGLEGRSVIEFVDKLEEEIYRSGPESVIDRCREAATAILSVYLQSLGEAKPGKDLAELSKKAEKQLQVASWSGQIIARLHARGKHAEQEKRAPRLVTEQDAEFAIQAVGIILCDLDWAYW